MAEQKLQFSIGSVFNGQGFNAAKKSIGDMSTSVKKAAGAAQSLAGSVSGMNTAASKAAGAMSNLLGVLATGSVVTMAVSAAVMILNKRMSELAQAQEEAKQSAAALQVALEKMKAAKDKAFDDALTKRVSDIKEQTQKLADEFERVAKNAVAMREAVSKTNAAKDAGQILGMQLQKQSKMNSVLESDRDLVAAQEDYKIQLQKNALALKKREEAINNAKDALQDNYARENNISDRIYAIRKEIEKLEDERNHLSGRELDKMKKYDDKIAALSSERSKLEKEYLDVESRRTALKQNIATAEQEYANQEKQNQLDLNEAEQKVIDARQKQADQINENIKKEREAAEKQLTKLQNELNKANSEVKNASTDFKQAVEDYRDARAAFMGNNFNWIDQALRNMDRSGIANSQNLQNPMVSWRDQNGKLQQGRAQDAVAQFALEQGLANGSIRNSRDANRAMRDAARAYRDAASSQEANQERRDANYLNRLRNMNPRAMSDKQKRDLENLEKLDAAKKKAGQQAEEAKKKAEQAKNKEAEAQQAVIDIKKKVEDIEKKLGVK